MDKEVYTVDSVGNYLNAGFISVKLQMDATINDNTHVKSGRTVEVIKWEEFAVLKSKEIGGMGKEFLETY